MTRKAIILRLGVLAGSLLMVLPAIAQQRNEPTTDLKVELRELQANRVAILKTLFDLRSVGYREGEFSLDGVLAAQHDLFEARLEMAETSDKRIAVLKSHISAAKETLQAAQYLRKAAAVS